ncbi:hypothetical protein KEM52_002697 [Ascosphaera acerosa]|nr:hypothetical protein KEM52_002697 [Ascosphaera acerosa]
MYRIPSQGSSDPRGPSPEDDAQVLILDGAQLQAGSHERAPLTDPNDGDDEDEAGSDAIELGEVAGHKSRLSTASTLRGVDTGNGRPRAFRTRGPYGPASRRRLRGAPMYALGALIALNVLLVTLSAASVVVLHTHVKQKSTRENTVYSPAREAVKWTPIRFDGDVASRNIYKAREGDGDEQWRAADAAWSALYEAVDPFAVSAAELRLMNESSFELPSRPGQHLVKLAVFHHVVLSALCTQADRTAPLQDMIRKYIHHPHYQFDEHQAHVSLIDHVDHCVDLLRQAISCHADTALITFVATDEVPKRMEPNFNVIHECRDFSAIQKWAKQQQVNMTDEVVQHLDLFVPMFRGNPPDRESEGAQSDAEMSAPSLEAPP